MGNGQTRRYKENAAAPHLAFFLFLFLSASLQISDQNLCPWLLFRHQRIALDIFHLSAIIIVNVQTSMSYHRVLPPPPALASQDISSWSIEPDSLLRHKIMTTESPNNFSRKTKSLTPFQNPSSPEADKALSSPGLQSLEDYVDSPQVGKKKSFSQISNESHKPRSRLPSVSWDLESPSQICLCQPDPKIPRPRNGIYYSLPPSLRNLQNIRLSWLSLHPFDQLLAA